MSNKSEKIMQKKRFLRHQMLPIIFSFVAIGVFFIVLLSTCYPIVSLDRSCEDKGKCVSVERKYIYGGRTTKKIFILLLDNGNEYYIDSASSFDGFNYNAFKKHQNNDEVVIVKYVYDKMNNGNMIVEMVSENGEVFLSHRDVNGHTLFFWCVIIGLYIFFGGFFCYYQFLKKSKNIGLF